MQTADCRPGSKCRLTRKTGVFFVVRHVVTFEFFKILILGNSPCLRFFYGTAEAGDILDCSQSPIFPWGRRCRSLSPTGRHLGLLMWAKLGESKMPVGRGDGVKSVGWGGGKNIFSRLPCPPPPLPTEILYSPQYRSHQETKMAARRTQRSTSTI